MIVNMVAKLMGLVNDEQFRRILAEENKRFAKDVLKMLPFLVAVLAFIFLVINGIFQMWCLIGLLVGYDCR